MTSLDDLRLQAERLMEACTSINTKARDRRAKPRRNGQSGMPGDIAVQLAGTKGARH